MRGEARDEGLRDAPHPALGVPHPAVVPVAEHHPRVDHRRERRLHRAPAVALHVDEREELLVADVPARHVPGVLRQVPGEGEAGERVAHELAKQVPGLLEAAELEGVERVEHLPALAVEPRDALRLVRERCRELGEELVVVPPDLDAQAVGVAGGGRQVVVDLGGVRDGLHRLAHRRQRPREQVGRALPPVRPLVRPEAEHHAAPHVEAGPAHRRVLASVASPRSSPFPPRGERGARRLGATRAHL